MINATNLAASINAFGFDIWARLPSKGNLVLSPLSVSNALTMTYGGARGRTAEQMAKVLHFDTELSPENAMVEFGSLYNEIRLASSSPAIQLRIVNRLFGERQYNFNSDFVSSIDEAFLATIERLDFKQHPDSCRTDINDWVARQTENRIKNLLPPTSITKDTRLVLANAVYFLANWLRRFDEQHSRYDSFKLPGSDGTTGVVMMRQQKTKQLYGEVGDVQLVELPYDGNDFSMLVVLPKKDDGLADVEKVIGVNKLTTWKRAVSTRTINLHFPRFELSPDTIDLVTPLKELGMQDAFTSSADFTGIASPSENKDQIWIGDVRSKSFIRVNEMGTEAAAATAVSMLRSMDNTKTFKADHPFLFFIQENTTGMILFMGRVTNPNA